MSRDRTKLQWIVTIWVLIVSSFVVIGNTFVERSNAAPILTILLGGDALKWAVHVAGVVKENVSGVKRKLDV